MADLTASQVKEYVQALEKDANHKQMRTDAESKLNVVYMLKVPDLPEHMTRGIGASEPSPLLLWLAGAIAADIMPFPTIPTVTPLGDDTKPAQEKADKLERWLANWRATADEGRRVNSDVVDNQLITPYAVMMLRCGPPDEDFPWRVDTPPYDTCFFHIERAPFRPTVLGRRYKQLVRKIEKELGQRKQWDSQAEVEYEDEGEKKTKKGAWSGKPTGFMWSKTDKGKGKWKAVGSEQAVGSSMSLPQSDAGPFEECEVMELHIEDRVYVLALNEGNEDGEIVWQGKSMTGGVSAVVVPGRYVGAGPLSDRMQATLWPAIQMIFLINGIRAERATRSRQIKPDVIVEQSPETLKGQQVAGNINQGTNAALEAGGPNIVNVNGRATLWATIPDPDLDAREERYWQELDRYINSWSEVSEPEVQKDSTANAFLTNLESKKRQKAPMLAHRDFGWMLLMKMALYSVTEYDRDFDVFATRGDEYEGAAKGSKETLSPSDLVDWEKKFKLYVETKSTTEAESRARVQDWAYRKGLGLSTQLEGVGAAGYTDEMDQVEKLAVAAGLQTVSAAIAQQVGIVTQERIRLRSKILLPLGQAMDPNAIAGSPQDATSSPTPMRAATVPGAAGGSG